MEMKQTCSVMKHGVKLIYRAVLIIFLYWSRLNIAEFFKIIYKDDINAISIFIVV